MRPSAQRERREAREQVAIYTEQLALEKEVIREQMQVKIKQYQEVRPLQLTCQRDADQHKEGEPGYHTA